MLKFRQEIVDELLAGYREPSDLMGPGGIVPSLIGQLLEAATAGELAAHLEVERAAGRWNARNGSTPKTVVTEAGPVEVRLPRDRAGTFEPQLVPKHARRFEGFDDRVIGLYAGGMSLEEIAGFLESAYQVELSRETLSQIVDRVMGDVRAWQNRPLDPVWPILYLDGLVVKIRHEGVVANRTVYLAVGVNMEGRKETLGMWVGGAESSKFWLKVVTDLRNRGVRDVLFACVDGLSGFPEAIEAVFPQATVQCCVVHLIRASMRFVSYKDRKDLARDLRAVYTAPNEEAAWDALVAFDTKWAARYPAVGETWRRAWDRFTPFLAYPEELRRVIYTTNSIEAVNRQCRKIIKTRGQFPNDDAAIKLLWLALRNAEKKWTYPIRDWNRALHQLNIMFPGRLDLTSITS